MLLKNVGARVIIINTQAGGQYYLLPGNEPAVEVPECKVAAPYIEGLINSGELIALSGSQKDEGAQNEDQPQTDERDEMIAELESLGVKVDKRWSNDRLKTELETALGE